jgi:hypothetical protein
MIKDDEIAMPSSCLNRAAGDEPLFVLRAKDPTAAFIVRVWCQLAWQTALHEPERIGEARALAEQMEDWRRRNAPALRSGLGTWR